MARTKRGRQHESGPLLFQRGRYYGADFRPYGGSRLSLRNPKDPGWPDFGERTQDLETARQWVQDYLAHYRDETRRRQQGRPKDWKLADAIKAFKAHRRRTVELTTLDSNNAALKHLLEWCGDVHVRRISTDKLQGLFDFMHDRGYAASTLMTQRWTLSAFFDWCGWHNPAKEITVAEPDKSEDIYAWEDADLDRLRQVADEIDGSTRTRDPSRRLLLDLAVCTGCRISEMLALRWEDFDEPSWTVRLVRQMQKGTTTPKGLKGDEARTAVVLKEWWDDHHREDRGYILQDAQGRPLKLRWVEKLFGAMLDGAGLNGPQRGPKDARATYSRLFLERGGWMDELQTSLGHKSITTTEKSYAKFAARVRAKFAVDRMRGGGRLRLLR